MLNCLYLISQNFAPFVRANRVHGFCLVWICFGCLIQSCLKWMVNCCIYIYLGLPYYFVFAFVNMTFKNRPMKQWNIRSFFSLLSDFWRLFYVCSVFLIEKMSMRCYLLIEILLLKSTSRYGCFIVVAFSSIINTDNIFSELSCGNWERKPIRP